MKLPHAMIQDVHLGTLVVMIALIITTVLGATSFELYVKILKRGRKTIDKKMVKVLKRTCINLKHLNNFDNYKFFFIFLGLINILTILKDL